MRDFPIFPTEYGVANLTLKEIPYKNTAYIRILDHQQGFFAEHLRECVAFCRMCGAETVFAAGHERLEAYPVHMTVLQMRRLASPDEKQVKNLFPVTEQTVAQWRGIYNERMRPIDDAATLESRDEQKIVKSGGAYFVHDDGRLLGIGWMEGTKLLAVAAVEKGAGEPVMHTLMSLADGQTVTLEVASTNSRALRLYEKLGFVKTAEIIRWYDVTDANKEDGQ